MIEALSKLNADDVATVETALKDNGLVICSLLCLVCCADVLILEMLASFYLLKYKMRYMYCKVFLPSDVSLI